jgi:TonB family protein
MNENQLLLSVTIKVTVILFAAFTINACLGRASAAWRHVVWTAALTCALLIPALLLVPAFVTVTMPIQAAASVEFPKAAAVAVTAHRESIHWQPWIMLIWATGLAAVVSRLILGTVRLSAISGRAILLRSNLLTALEERLALAKSVEVKLSGGVAMPMTWGVIDSTVLLPEDVGSWPEDRLRAVLTHELIHVKRHDCATSILAHVACAVYWFHPLAWLAAARLRRERECACDDAVLQLDSRASDYAAHLLDLARSLGAARDRVPAVAMAQVSDLETRLKSLLNPSVDRRAPGRRGLVLASIAALALLAGVSTLRMQAQNTGSRLHGVIYDPSGAAVPNATIIATNTAGHNKEITKSGDDGQYSFTGIPDGHYLLEVLARGFAVLQKNNVAVSAGDDQALDLALAPGSVKETIDVVAKGVKPPPANAATGSVRIGGNVQPLKLIRQVKPVYPAGALARGAEGSVLLRAVVAMNGKLLSIKPLNTTVDPDLVQAAVDAVEQWEYQPTLLNGKPVEIVTDITVNFNISQ